MFRSAIARSAPALVRRAVVSVPRPATRLLSVAAAAATAPRHAMRRVAPQVAAVQGMRYYSAGGALVKTEVEGRIMSLLAGFDKVNDLENIKPGAHFANDLGLDSLDTVEVVMAIEEEFSIEIPDKDADTIHSVNQAVEYILNQPDAH